VGAEVPQLANKFTAQNILINYYGTKTFHKQASTGGEHTITMCAFLIIIMPKPFNSNNKSYTQ
jgi:hypothetical protein